MKHNTPAQEVKSLETLFFTFFKIGLFTFGGGYAMIALLEEEFIQRRKWLDKDEFLDMTAIAESTPGPVAINSATYLGYKLAKVPGAATATVAVCLPSFLIIYAISLFFEQLRAAVSLMPRTDCKTSTTSSSKKAAESRALTHSSPLTSLNAARKASVLPCLSMKRSSFATLRSSP